jgi:hypothetical protein
LAVCQSTKDGDDSIHKEEKLNGPKEPTLSGHNLQLTTEFRYFRLILDRGLSWNALLKKVMNTAYWAFYTCTGTFGKMWGLTTRVLYWIYALVIRLILICESMIWWPRVKPISRMGFNELQRLGCLAITWVLPISQQQQ